jgi:PAS domain S-box-containing protein
MQVAFIEVIVLLHAAFAGVFFFLNRQRPNRFARLFAWCWSIEAVRAMILLPAVHDIGGWPLYWYSVADVLCVVADWCLFAGFADFANVRLPRWLGPLYFWASVPAVLITRYVLQPLVHARMGVPIERADFIFGFVNQLLLFVPVTAARLTILVWLYRFWKTARIPGALVAVIFAVPFALFSIGAPLQNYFSYNPSWITFVWCVRVLGFSVGLVILMFNRQQSAAFVSEAGMVAAQALAHLGSWELNLETMTGTWSAEMSRLHGCDPSRGAPTFSEFIETVHPDDRASVLAVHARIPVDTGPISHEYRTNPERGPLRYLSSTVHIIRDGSGRAVRVEGNSLDVTERKRTELTLAGNEERYRLLFERSPLPKWVYERETLRILEVNGAALALYGYSRDEFLAMTIRDILTAEDISALGPRAASTHYRQPNSGEWKHRRKDGTVIDVVVFAHDVDMGSQRARMIVVQDITTEKRAEQALREAEGKYRTIFENAMEGIYRSTPDGRFLAANPMMARILGYALPEDLICDRVDIARQGYVDPQRREEFRHQVETHGTITGFEYAARRKDGSEVWVSENARVARNPQGEIVYYEGTLVDISDRKRAEEALRVTRGQLERVLGTSPTVVYSLAVVGEKFTPTYFSGNLRSMLGYEFQDTLQPNWWLENLHPADKEHVLTNATKLLAVGYAALDYRFRNKEGSFRWLRDEQRLLYNTHNEPIEVVGSWTDVTERVNLETQLRQSQKMEAIGQLAGGVAHDFNNLLTVIKGYTQLLLTDDLHTSEAREVLGEVFAAATRAGQLTHQLLAFSRKQAVQLQNIDLNETVMNLGKMLQRLIGENVTLDLDCAADVPRVRADSGMLEQVLMNLAINARDAMPEGGRLQIATGRALVTGNTEQRNRSSYPGVFATIRVRDTGCGMSQETSSRIFEPFFTTKAPGKGTGLGLATAYGIMQQHQGWIEVESEVGKGSTFFVFLPEAVSGAKETKGDSESGLTPAGTESILVVEDEMAVRQLARKVLQRIGYNVFEASSGPGALAIWRQHRATIAMMITDVMLPEGPSGFQLAQAMRAERPELKVVFTSGYIGPDAQQGVVLKPGVNFLPKPYMPNALAHVVRKCLDSPSVGLD